MHFNSMSPSEAPDNSCQPREFHTTHWSAVLQAGRSESPQSAAALASLCQIYWYPLDAYVRRLGHTSNQRGLARRLYWRGPRE